MNYILRTNVELTRPQEEVVWQTIATVGERESHELRVTFLRGGEPVSLEDREVFLYVQRQDDATVLMKGEVQGKEAVALLGGSCYEVPGNLTAILLVCEGRKAVCGLRVHLLVRELHGETVVDAAGAVPNLQELLRLVAVMEARKLDIETGIAAIGKMEDRIRNAEEERTAKEEERGAAERSRQEGEALRTLAELGRIGGEKSRETAEEERQEAEAFRAVAEEDREAAEEKREAEESERIQAENRRNEAEARRAEAEDAREREVSSALQEMESMKTAARRLAEAEIAAVTLPAGAEASAELTEKEGGGTVLTYGIPQGAAGVTPCLEVEETETLPAGAAATVRISGEKERPRLHFGIPRGESGSVVSVNGIAPDPSGNVTIAAGNTGVQSINGRTGDVVLTAGELGAVTGVAGGSRADDGFVTLPAASDTDAGLMSAEEHRKLAGMEEYANRYMHPAGSGYRHVPAGGSTGQILRFSEDGLAGWGEEQKVTSVAGNRVSLTFSDGVLAILMTDADGEKLDTATVTEREIRVDAG